MRIFTMVSGVYEEYAPFFRRFAETAYPEAEVIIGSVENPVTRHDAACTRFLLEQPGADYVYITDVDMMLLREDPTLMEFHLAEMKESGLSYSNTPRGSEQDGPNRLTGLHFCSQRWYDETRAYRMKFQRRLEDGNWGNGRIDDELMLMDMCRPLGVPPKRRLVTRHHGIHLGTARSYRRRTRQRMRSALNARVKPWQAKAFTEIIDMDQVSKIGNPDIREEFEIIYDYSMGRKQGISEPRKVFASG